MTERLLALDPNSRGFGYAVFEGPKRLIDWGLKYVGTENKSARTVLEIRRLVDFVKPNVLVLEDVSLLDCKLRARIRELITTVLQEAVHWPVRVVPVSRQRVYTLLGTEQEATKYEAAIWLATHYRELTALLPPKRRSWENEHPRFSIFDAATLAMGYYHQSNLLTFNHEKENTHQNPGA